MARAHRFSIYQDVEARFGASRLATYGALRAHHARAQVPTLTQLPTAQLGWEQACKGCVAARLAFSAALKRGLFGQLRAKTRLKALCSLPPEGPAGVF
mmetsp:Transcript_28492/g.64628  ORF Transcript_28492/g.64628 Transcript_28492/m.64628 type:complete len:98 (-) Transcript_28492:58-351(-)